MFVGRHINTTEDRAGTARRPAHAERRVLARRRPRRGRRRPRRLGQDGRHRGPDSQRHLAGATGERIRAVVNIGIGGSDLGPAMATEALADYAHPDIASRFVSNVDPVDLYAATHDLDPATTLFVISSKTFTTLETLTIAYGGPRVAVGWTRGHVRPIRGGQAFRGRFDQSRRRRSVRYRPRQHARGFGTGSVVVIHMTQPLVSRRWWRSVPSISPRCSRASAPLMSTSPPHPLDRTCRSSPGS